MNLNQLHPFVAAYIEAALWSSMDNSDLNTGGDPLDANYTIHDIDPETLTTMKEEAAQFYEENLPLIQLWPEGSPYTAEEIGGHDFWLTRNGHGSGYWDGDWPKAVGEELTRKAKAYGEYDLYIGDDNKIYGG